MKTSSIHERQKRFITVMFVDIVRSSDLLREVSAEKAAEIFDAILLRQSDICTARGGIVNQIMGDGMMCLFGAESPCEDHAFEAMSAAEDMLADILAFGETHHMHNLSIRIGINTGEVVLKPADGTNYGARYQVTGEAVHIADRILKAAPPNSALASDKSCKLMEKFFQFKKVSELQWHDSNERIFLYKKPARKPRRPPPIRSISAAKKRWRSSITCKIRFAIGG